MALFPIHQFFSLNGNLTPNNKFVASENEGGVYEVIRIAQSVPFFWEEHIGRFFRSADIAGKVIPFQAAQIKIFISELIERNKVTEGNVLVSCKTNLKVFFIPHKYPEAEEYNKGVACGLLHAERENPNAKVFQTNVRATANKLISEHGFYEVILIDHAGLVTEGSRSNVFFIKGEKLFTALPNNVLLGITREKTFECAKAINVNVLEKDIMLSEISSFDAAFLTGTSPKILPVKQIEDIVFSTNHSILQELIYQYDLMINNYIKKNKSNHLLHL